MANGTFCRFWIRCAPTLVSKKSSPPSHQSRAGSVGAATKVIGFGWTRVQLLSAGVVRRTGAMALGCGGSVADHAQEAKRAFLFNSFSRAAFCNQARHCIAQSSTATAFASPVCELHFCCEKT